MTKKKDKTDGSKWRFARSILEGQAGVDSDHKEDLALLQDWERLGEKEKCGRDEQRFEEARPGSTWRLLALTRIEMESH